MTTAFVIPQTIAATRLAVREVDAHEPDAWACGAHTGTWPVVERRSAPGWHGDGYPPDRWQTATTLEPTELEPSELRGMAVAVVSPGRYTLTRPRQTSADGMSVRGSTVTGYGWGVLEHVTADAPVLIVHNAGDASQLAAPMVDPGAPVPPAGTLTVPGGFDEVDAATWAAWWRTTGAPIYLAHRDGHSIYAAA